LGYPPHRAELTLVELGNADIPKTAFPRETQTWPKSYRDVFPTSTVRSSLPAAHRLSDKMLSSLTRSSSRFGVAIAAKARAAAASTVAGTTLQPARTWDDGVADGFKAVTADELFKASPSPSLSSAPRSPSLVQPYSALQVLIVAVTDLALIPIVTGSE
jgi:hypothetical protein